MYNKENLYYVLSAMSYTDSYLGGLPTRVNHAVWTACSANRGGATCVPLLLVFRWPRLTRLETRATCVVTYMKNYGFNISK